MELEEFAKLAYVEPDVAEIWRSDYDATASWDDLDPAECTEAFQGEAESEASYAATLADDIGPTPDGPPWLLSCIDWDRVWQELRLGDGYWSEPTGRGTIYVFRGV